MFEEEIIKKKYVHKCTLPKINSISEFIHNDNYIRKKFTNFYIVSSNASHRQNYVKSTRVLDKERKIHLLHHHNLVHPFSDFSYFWQITMIIINSVQLLITPFYIINRVKINAFTILTLIAQTMGIINIIIQFNTGHYRCDIKEVQFDRKHIAKHYLRTYFFADLLGSFPIHIILYIFDFNTTTILISSLAIGCNTGNFIKCIENIREKRDMDLVLVRLFASFVIAGIGLLWITALCSVAANLDETDNPCKADIWWWIYLNFILLTGTSINDFTYIGYEIICKIIALLFGFGIRNYILVQLILFFKTYTVNQLKKNRLWLELNEFCYEKMLPINIKEKIFDYYKFKFSSVYYNETDVWMILSESMRQNILDYDSKEWFEGDIFKLCPLVLRQLIAINLGREIFLKDDVIYSRSDVLTRIYFIKTGSVKLVDEDGNMAHLIHEGNFFSEKALLLKDGMNHIYTAIALENCQLFSLKTKAFKKLINNFPEEYEIIIDILLKRHQFILNNKRLMRRLILEDYYDSTVHDTYKRKKTDVGDKN